MRLLGVHHTSQSKRITINNKAYKMKRRSQQQPQMPLVVIISLLLATSINSFAPNLLRPSNTQFQTIQQQSTTSLNALGVFVRKAKEADVRAYCEAGPPESVLNILKQITDDAQVANSKMGELQESLTKRKGTITIIAEYKRKLEGTGFVSEIPEPELLSPVFREFGAAAVAVLADDRTGGCTYDDIKQVIEEQEEARGEVPGPLPVISSDLIVDEIQIAQSKEAGAKAVTVTYGVVGAEKTTQFINNAASIGLEVIVNVASAEEAQGAVDAGASIISVCGVDGADNKYEVIESLSIPEGRKVCTIANILAKDNKALEEVEEAWICRDKGFNCVWVSDALYKSGNDPVEHPGAIINSMKAKSSVKYASPKARSGKGEGAREYLGDILM